MKRWVFLSIIKKISGRSCLFSINQGKIENISYISIFILTNLLLWTEDIEDLFCPLQIHPRNTAFLETITRTQVLFFVLINKEWSVKTPTLTSEHSYKMQRKRTAGDSGHAFNSTHNGGLLSVLTFIRHSKTLSNISRTLLDSDLYYPW